VSALIRIRGFLDGKEFTRAGCVPGGLAFRHARGSLHAQQIAAHESPRPTELYNQTQDELSLDGIERTVISLRIVRRKMAGTGISDPICDT